MKKAKISRREKTTKRSKKQRNKNEENECKTLKVSNISTILKQIWDQNSVFQERKKSGISGSLKDI